MATIESLDLAQLANNPQSIAEALEDVLEVSGGNISSSALSKILNTNERCEASNFSRQQIGDSMNIKTEKFKP